MPKELTLTIKASELPAVKEYIAGLVAERDALAAEVERLREALQRLREEILDEDPTPAGWANQINDALSLQGARND